MNSSVIDMTISQAQKDPGILQTVSLLTTYGFDLRGITPLQLINSWRGDFSALWIRLAVIEALYLGRYKAISVEHLLEFWNEKGQPNLHFSADFERMVSHNLPKSSAESEEELAKKLDQGPGAKVPPTAQKLPPEKLTDLPKEGLLTLNRGSQPSQRENPPRAPRSPLAAPSIEQFIPITTESDLLSRIKSALTQDTENG